MDLAFESLDCTGETVPNGEGAAARCMMRKLNQLQGGSDFDLYLYSSRMETQHLIIFNGIFDQGVNSSKKDGEYISSKEENMYGLIGLDPSRDEVHIGHTLVHEWLHGALEVYAPAGVDPPEMDRAAHNRIGGIFAYGNIFPLSDNNVDLFLKYLPRVGDQYEIESRPEAFPDRPVDVDIPLRRVDPVWIDVTSKEN